MTKPTRGIKKLLAKLDTHTIYRVPDEKGGWMFVWAGGKAIRKDVVKRAIDEGYIKPSGDSLFESEQSQSWRKA